MLQEIRRMSPCERWKRKTRRAGRTVANGRNVLVSAVLVCAFGSHALRSSAQSGPYKLSAGLRGGFTSGVCAKFFIKDDIAAEGIAGMYFAQGSNLTLLLEKHWSSIADVDGLFFYAGLGGHVGFWSSYYKYRSGDFFAGVDAIAGLEYSLEPYELPLTVSLDVKPKLDVFNYYSGYFLGTGVSVRYIIK